MKKTSYGVVALAEIVCLLSVFFLMRVAKAPPIVAGVLFAVFGVGMFFFMCHGGKRNAFLWRALIAVYAFLSVFLIGGTLGQGIENDTVAYSFGPLPAYWVHRATEILFVAIFFLSVGLFARSFKFRASKS